MKRTCSVTICLEPETKAKAQVLAKEEHRALSAQIRQIIKRSIRAYEAEHGPIRTEGRAP